MARLHETEQQRLRSQDRDDGDDGDDDSDEIRGACAHWRDAAMHPVTGEPEIPQGLQGAPKRSLRTKELQRSRRRSRSGGGSRNRSGSNSTGGSWSISKST